MTEVAELNSSIVEANKALDALNDRLGKDVQEFQDFVNSLVGIQ